MKFQSISLALLCSLAASTFGCATEPAEKETESSESAIVDVPHTDVERQSIGNCWIYAHASWIESMHKSATGEDFDLSQSYWTYWHWFDQIAGGSSSSVSTGGNWTTANNIVRKYGLIAEKDFIFEDTLDEMSNRQKLALDRINESLKSGALKELGARRDRKLLRQELDLAWGLTADQSAMLDQVFGEYSERTFAMRTADPAGTPILSANDFAVSYPLGPNRLPTMRNLSQAMQEWRQVYYSAFDRRNFLLRVQKALHATQPVIITWFVDFNAMENRYNERRGSFNMTTLNEFGPGSQGGHMTVLEDYQAKLADGTLLEAGKTLDPNNEEEAKLLERALDRSTEIEFFRVKNSWGSARPDRAFSPGMPGYHDLYMDYLNGPVKRCLTRADGETDTSNCPYNHTPLQNVVLPPGF